MISYLMVDHNKNAGIFIHDFNFMRHKIKKEVYGVMTEIIL